MNTRFFTVSVRQKNLDDSLVAEYAFESQKQAAEFCIKLLEYAEKNSVFKEFAYIVGPNSHTLCALTAEIAMDDFVSVYGDLYEDYPNA